MCCGGNLTRLLIPASTATVLPPEGHLPEALAASLQTSCPTCGIRTSSTFKWCPQCGSTLKPHACSYCGHMLAPGAGTCPQCGAPAGRN